MDYLFIITEFPDEEGNEPIVHKLSPIDAYSFLLHEHPYLPKIAVLSNNDFLVMLYPASDKNRIVYHDSVWNHFVKPEAYYIFNYIESMDKRMEGQFKIVYEEEFFRRSEDGEKLYNPFAQTLNNLNWKAMSSLRKNFIKSQMPPNFNNRFKNRTRKERYGTWQGATPTAEAEGTRSRKTRKTRR
jgi:hypothetical protein